VTVAAPTTEQRPVGAAMWGGRAWPEGRPLPDAPPGRPIPPSVVRAFVSLLVVILGALLAAVGAGVAWGIGVGLFVTGILAVGVGVLLGVSR